MDSFLIHGGVPLHGEVAISGSKNSALPILAATLLTAEPCILRRVPRLSDTEFMCKILASLGAKVAFEGDTVRVEARDLNPVGDYNLIRKMRGSFCIAGPLLGRLREAKVAHPGGCVIGTRPVNLHLKGFRALGAEVGIDDGYVHLRGPRLEGTEIFLGGRAGSTVLGTANVMMAAVLAEGVTVIQSAACEPELADLAEFLIAMGARITGAGTPTITIIGVPELHGAEHHIIADRIEAATFLIAAAATRGEVTVTGARPDHLSAVLDKLTEAGVRVDRKGTALHAHAPAALRPADVTTQPYAGFPTDVQAQFMALMALAPGTSVITERIYESRFMHAAELARLGAEVEIEGPAAIVKGGRPLHGATIMASDLRASAALVIAGMAAAGTTQVNRIYHIDRGYEDIDGKLRRLGARLERIQET
jgi:UDP-N-acetylglucosamine 1-carboxyvinyltransferase